MKIMDALAIRDTAAHNSDVLEELNVIHKTFIIENLLNRDVSLQWQASANEDFSNPFNVAAPFVVVAGASDYATCSNLFPYCRVAATALVSNPTSGALTIHVFKYTGA